MFKKKSRLFLLILGIIFVVATLFRFYQLSNYPAGFHIDEASLGYNAYSLLHTGKDENNHVLPLYIDMFGDNRPSGYHFLATIPVAFFGLSVFATRFPAAAFGSLSVFVIFLLGYVLFEDVLVALLGAGIMAIAPWSVVLSRASGEAIIALFFILLGFTGIFYSLKRDHIPTLIYGTLSICLSFFFYHTPRVFVPLFFLTLVGYVALQWKHYAKKYLGAFLGCFLVTCFISFSLVFLITGGTGRYSQVNIFGFPETKLVTAEQIREDGVMHTGVLQSRIFHNKILAYGNTFLNNYFTYFDNDFLFMKGGLPKWYIVPQTGLLYLFELPFILLGVIKILTAKQKLSRMLLVWLIVAPVTAAITVDDIPNINRVIVMFPIFDLLAAFGIVQVFTFLKPKWRLLGSGLLTLFVLTNGVYFMHQYFVHAPVHQNWYRNVGFDTMTSHVMAVENSYDKIVVTKANGGIYPLILFYTKFDPSVYQQEGSPKDKAYAGFGKFFFVPQSCPASNRDSRFPKGKILYVEAGQCGDVPGAARQEYIRRLDDTAVFHLVYE